MVRIKDEHDLETLRQVALLYDNENKRLIDKVMKLTLEKAMAYITDEELVEVTPRSIRLRKRWLDPNMRKKMERSRERDVA